MHRNMETPFFAHRLGTGNAVVGCWLKTYKEEDVIVEYPIEGTTKQRQTPIPKAWWAKEPKRVKWDSKGNLTRKENEYYHFLLPDDNMLSSANIKLIKDELSTAQKSAVTQWKKEMKQPLTRDECKRLGKICIVIDALLEEHYLQIKSIIKETTSTYLVYGQLSPQITIKGYDEKELLAESRNARSAPFYKLRMVMDYWCSLWFWDARKVADLPTRQEWYNEIENILGVELAGLDENATSKEIFENIKKLSVDLSTLFVNVNRLQTVEVLQNQHRFFHNELEFIEIFKENGGFDVIVGNPPWVNIEFDNEGFISSYDPLPVIKGYSSPEINIEMKKVSKRDKLFSELLTNELIEVESFSNYVSSIQNYQLLFGQKPNLYKSIIENSFLLINKNGFCGLLHPQGLYDDPFGDRFRNVLYKKLKYHFQFQNELKLFSEIGNRNVFSINIYSGSSTNIDFQAIFSLFHPSTIEGCFIETKYQNELRGIKAKNSKNENVWNVAPNSNRLIHFESEVFERLDVAFETNGNIGKIILPSFFNKELLSILIKLATFSGKVSKKKSIIPECWNETRAVASGIIKRETTFPSYNSYECIFSGPFFFINNPLYQTPKQVCETHRAYEIIDLTKIDNSFWGRTNYVPLEDVEIFKNRIEGFEENKPWIDNYKIFLSKMLSPSGERTLQPSLAPPKVSHTNGVASITFESEKDILEFLSITSSLILDFYIKLLRKTNLYDNTIKDFPLGIHEKYLNHLFVRVLMLNCLNEYYSSIWSNFYNISWKIFQWSKSDLRLKSFNLLGEKWNWNIPLRNSFERRFCSVEVDIIIAQALGLNLEDLIYAYLVQFPVLQENEDDTWYDQKGNIVFTCSKGLSGVGLDRSEWENVTLEVNPMQRKLKDGDKYVQIISKSELYQGQQITYYPPFDKCDRVEDYKVAWKHFEKLFASENSITNSVNV